MFFIFLKVLEDELVDGIVEQEYFVAFFHETLKVGGVKDLVSGLTGQEVDHVLVLLHPV